MNKIKGYFDLIRPFTLLAPIIVSICIIAASFIYNGNQKISSYLLMQEIWIATWFFL